MWRLATKMTVVLGLYVLFASIQPASAQLASAQLAQRALGVWADENGESNIEIAQCGEYLCGRVVWLKDPTDASGRPLTDIENPDKLLRSRPILGLMIMEGLELDEDNSRLKGQVYNADNGKVFDIYLKPHGQTMKVKGCFLRFLCGSQTWTRVR